MSQTRKIELTIHEDADKHSTGLQQGIGYAAMWGNPDVVRIFVDDKSNISAAYSRITYPTPDIPIAHEERFFYMEGFPNHCVKATTDKNGHTRTNYCFHS